MDERSQLIAAVRELIELERASGVEYLGRATVPTASPVPAVSRSLPVAAVPSAPALVALPLAAPTPAARTAVSATTTAVPQGFSAYSTGERHPDTRVAEVASPVVAPAPAVLADDSLDRIAAEVKACTRCPLHAIRRNTVPGEGNPQPELVFIGEGPGVDEDEAGRPFVGRAGELLTAMISGMGFARSDVFICNTVKCHPPGEDTPNRAPTPEEVVCCIPFLHRQLALLKPKVICTLGNVPLKALFGPDIGGITTVRGRRLDWRGTVVIPTYHPAYLLRNPTAKKPCWDDLKTVLGVLGRTPPVRKS